MSTPIYTHVDQNTTGVTVNFTYIKNFQMRMYKVGNVIYVDGDIVFNSTGLNIADVITGLPYKNAGHARFIAASYNGAATAMLDIAKGKIGLIGSAVQTGVEYNYNFSYVII